MEAVRQQFCPDTVNTFGHDDQNFWWSNTYYYYSSPSALKKKRRWCLGASRDIFQAKEFQGNPPALMDDVEVDVVNFNPEEDGPMDDDTMMDDGNSDVVPTTMTKLKSTITGGTSQLDDDGPENTKGRGFRKETGVERNGLFAAREFESLGLDGGPRPHRYVLSFHFLRFLDWVWICPWCSLRP
jgi:hypothetical protein